MGYTLSATLDRPHARTLTDVRAALADQGFGILTEIDLAATLATKLGVEVAPHVILGACRPQLAHRALQLDPSIGALLPCNVVVRAVDDGTTVVEAFDPDAMTRLADDAGTTGPDGLAEVAQDARRRLTAALTALTEEN